MPAEQFAAAAVDHQGQGCPTIPARPNPAQVRGPALIRPLGDRGQRLDPGAKAEHMTPSLYLLIDTEFL